MKGKTFLILAIIGAQWVSVLCSHGEPRSPGIYNGTVIFDRWDGCILYQGIYVMYISEKVKEQLRPYAGQAVRLDAKEVIQPVNPGDGRIEKFTYLGNAPEIQNSKMKEVQLSAQLVSKYGSKPILRINICNNGKSSVKIQSSELAPTLLTGKDSEWESSFNPSDAASYALVTRRDLGTTGSNFSNWSGEGGGAKKTYSWTIGEENALPQSFVLEPGKSKIVDICFKLLGGEYEFLCGYTDDGSSRKCLTSNLVAFDVNEKGDVVKNGRK
ncbi:MAG: hypothetical protein ABI615_07530 [Chthoniobacterales bacterium]